VCACACESAIARDRRDLSTADRFVGRPDLRTVGSGQNVATGPDQGARGDPDVAPTRRGGVMSNGTSRLDVSLRKKTPRAGSFRSPSTPDPPRPPVKTTSPQSRVFSRTRPPKATRVALDDANGTGSMSRMDAPHAAEVTEDMTSPYYDPKISHSFYDQCYKQMDTLGSGSYATVYEVLSLEDRRLYAVKRTARKFTSTSDRKRKIEEMYVAKRIGDHNQLVQYFDAWEEDGQLFIKMELCRGGSLKDYALSHTMDEATLWSFFFDIVQGLSHIHAAGYTHFDLKPANIFVTDDKGLKIGDFGIAVNHLDGEMAWSRGERDDGDPIYMPPELLNTDYIGPKVDIFSAGMTMLDLVSGRELPGQGPNWHTLRQGSLPSELFDGVSSEMAGLIQEMLNPDYLQRPAADELLRHPRFQRIARRRWLWRQAVKPVHWIAAVCRYVVAVVLMVVAGVVEKCDPTMRTPRRHSDRRTGSASAVAASSPAMMLPGSGLEDSPISEPIRTRLNFDDNGSGDTDWNARPPPHLLHRRRGDSPTHTRSMSFRSLFSDDDG